MVERGSERRILQPLLGMGNDPGNKTDAAGGETDNPIFGLDGRFLGTDSKGIQGEAYFMSEDNFTKGMDHNVARGLNQGVSKLGPESRSWYESVYKTFPTRPDWDGVLTKAEADKWWVEGGGKPLYVDFEKMKISMNTAEFANAQNGTMYKNFGFDLRNYSSMGKVYGTVQLSLVVIGQGKL
ncbi:MAG: hypothetical protein J7539_16160 [Niabella sp.]|nr:hypothetical protein [Niabella sp.]